MSRVSEPPLRYRCGLAKERERERERTTRAGGGFRARENVILFFLLPLSRRPRFVRTRTNFPREIGGRIETSCLSPAIVRSSPPLHYFPALFCVQRAPLPRNLRRCCSISAARCIRAPLLTLGTDLALARFPRQDPPEIRFSTTTDIREIRLPRRDGISFRNLVQRRTGKHSLGPLSRRATQHRDEISLISETR